MEGDVLRARLIHIAIAVSLGIHAFGFWVNRDRAFTDFRVLHLGGRLLNAGRGAEAYDPDRFLEIASTDPELAQSVRELDVFISIPTFAWLIRPFALLPSNVALVLWLTLSALALVGAVKLLRLPWWTSLIALVMPFGVGHIYHAQTGFFALLWAAAIHRLCVDDRKLEAGALAGLAVLKPTLLLGIALWWLVDWRRWWGSLAAAAAVGTALVVPTVIAGFDHWRNFLDALSKRAALDQEVIANQPTIGEAISRTFGTDIGGGWPAILGVLAAGLIVMFFVRRRWPERTDILAGFAIALSVVVSPHHLLYDNAILLIPFAVAAHAQTSRRSLEGMVALYGTTSLLMIWAPGRLADLTKWTAPSTLGLLAAGALWLHSLRLHSIHRVANGAGIVELRADAETRSAA